MWRTQKAKLFQGGGVQVGIETAGGQWTSERWQSIHEVRQDDELQLM